MAYPTAYSSTVAIPLPSEQTVQQIMGKSYQPEKTLNVLKMFAGTEDMFEATIGIVKAMFSAKGIDPKIRETIILRAAKVLNAPYEAQANVVMAKNAGLSAAEIDAAATDGPVSGIIRNISSCRVVTGWPVTVLSRGRVVVDDATLRAAPGSGRFLARQAGAAALPTGRRGLEFDPAQNFGAHI